MPNQLLPKSTAPNQPATIEAPSAGPTQIGPFQFVIPILSLVVLGLLVAETFFQLPPEIVSILTKADTLLRVVFLVDFAVRFRAAPAGASVR